MQSGPPLTPPTSYTLCSQRWYHQDGTPYIQQVGKPTSPGGTPYTSHDGTPYHHCCFSFSVGTTWLYRWISGSAGPSPVYLYPLTHCAGGYPCSRVHLLHSRQVVNLQPPGVHRIHFVQVDIHAVGSTSYTPRFLHHMLTGVAPPG